MMAVTRIRQSIGNKTGDGVIRVREMKEGNGMFNKCSTDARRLVTGSQKGTSNATGGCFSVVDTPLSKGAHRERGWNAVRGATQPPLPLMSVVDAPLVTPAQRVPDWIAVRGSPPTSLPPLSVFAPAPDTHPQLASSWIGP